jgi:hypothetical protein
MIAYARRASAILFTILRSRGDLRPFLLPANVCPIVAITFQEAGVPFRCVDISETNLEIDASECLRLLGRYPGHFGGVLFVRPYGHIRDIEPFIKRVKKAAPDAVVIDDRCLCPPEIDRPPDTVADAVLFSTGGGKQVDAGGGGFAFLRDGLPYESQHGACEESAASAVEDLYRAAVVNRLPFPGAPRGWLDLREPAPAWEVYREMVTAARRRAERHKRALNHLYESEVPPEAQLSPGFQGWRFNVRVREPDVLVARLMAQGLFAGRHYPTLAPAFDAGRYPVADRLHNEVVNLFNDSAFDAERARAAARVVAQHVAEIGVPARATVTAGPRRSPGRAMTTGGAGTMGSVDEPA